MSFLAHLAESKGVWGPFLVISPASTLHNWDRELHTFLPEFKVCIIVGALLYCCRPFASTANLPHTL